MGRWLFAFFLACAAALPAEAAWREASTNHFVIYSEQSAESLREFATRLEKYDKAMRLVRNMADEPRGDANRLTIYVVQDLGAVRKLHGSGRSSGGYGVAGFYVPRAGGSVAITPRRSGDNGRFDLDAETVLLHEYAHHFMMQNFPGAFPAWFIEGFAEFHSTARFERDGAVGIGAPALHRAYGLVLGDKLPIEKMMANDGTQLTAALHESLYGRGWLLTHLLTFEPSRKGQLATYIAKLNQGVSGLDAAKAAFGDLKQLDRDLDRYLKRKRMNYWRLPPAEFTIGEIRLRDLGPAENAVMELKIRSRRGVDEAQAKELLPLVRRAAAPFPKDPFAQATLAEAEYDAGYFAEAEAAADRALVANPKYIDALIYKARAQMGAGVKNGVTDNTKWNAIRKAVIAANRADPNHPEPLILFYRSFIAQGTEPTKNAVEGLVTASHAAPQDRGLRMNVAMQMLKDGKAADARRALAPIAFDPHGGRLGEVAALILAKLDEGGAKAAFELAASVSESAAEENDED
jgi:tetratricopeptide (TPR) repeat protein